MAEFFTEEELFKYDRTEYGQERWEFEPEWDFAIAPGWLMDAVHSSPPLTPMATNLVAECASLGWEYAGEYLSFPHKRGNAYKTLRGGLYITPVIVDDEEEIKQREIKFREVIRPYVEDFGKQYDMHKQEMIKLLEPLRRVELEKAEPYQLLDWWDEFWHGALHFWKLHFIHIQIGATLWSMLLLKVREIGIDETSPLFLRLMQGFDNELLRADAEAEGLALRATELGVRNIFVETEPKASLVIPKLEASIDGRKWLGEFRDWLHHRGMRCPRLIELVYPTWIEDPSPPIGIIKNYLVGESAGRLAEAKKGAEADRKRAEDEVTYMFPEAERGEFRRLLKNGQACHTFFDEHDYFWDLYTYAIGQRLLHHGVGRWMAAQGMIDDIRDTTYLGNSELRDVIFGRRKIQPLIKKRKEIYNRYDAEITRLPPLLGFSGIEEAMSYIQRATAYVLLLLVIGSPPKVKPELKADIYGVGASLGVSEGTARVVIHEMDLRELKKGEILVAPATSPSWTWAFALAGGVVTNFGGVASHAAIVSREFGIPSVVNTMIATSKIKTGQRVRVDANNSCVYILE